MPNNRCRRIAIIYDNTLRPDTTGEYCRRALESLGIAVSHYGPGEAAEIPPIYELYLRVDDDLEYAVPETLRPLAYWAIDTHRDYARRLASARAADAVFCAQRNGAARLRADGIPNARWLPLACDPALHRRIPGVAKQYDVCFVGNTFPGDGERSRLVQWIQATYPNVFVGRAYGDEMARIYAASRLVFNCAIQDDVNMRVFEAAACGSLLVTNDLSANGQDLLFQPGVHLATYRSADDLPAVLEHYLRDPAERERIAEAGMRHAHSRHTYARRMGEALAAIFDGADLRERYPMAEGTGAPAAESPAPIPVGAAGPATPPVGGVRASIVIPAFNQLALTQQCAASIAAYTDVPHEVIVVDNGSTDGTGAWARREGFCVIANAENLGFPRACNQGMLAAAGEYIVLLNNDTLVSPGWLSGLIRHAEADPAAGLVGATTNLAASHQQIPVAYTTVEEFLALARTLAVERAGDAQEVNRLVGLCLLIPRRVMQAVGLLDGRFGMGLFEDDDYCLRVRMAGYRLLVARDVFIHHEGHRTFRTFTQEAYRRDLQANERRFREKWDVARHLWAWEEETRLVARVQAGAAQPWDLLRAGRYPEAYDAFERACLADPGDPRALVGLGLAAEGRGAPSAAVVAYRTALRIAPGHPDATRGLERVAPAGRGC